MYDTIISRGGHSCGVRNALRRTFATFLTLASGIPALAQAVESVDPETDAVIIREVRRKLTNVRRAEDRPTVALVLCGGGAKGAAHIGVLKAIEELGIPVDFISGTSIGALVGGLYAVGYKADFIDSLFHNQNWGVTLTDRIGSEYIPYRTRQHKSRYLLTVPFEFHDPDFKDHLKEGNVFSKHGIMSSLPAGYVHGFNVNNMLSSLTVGYQDSISFADLPIPFMCVATDLASCKAKNWGGGDLKRAMRASMSIPGLFNPVRTEDMILVDGGICNNFPVDLAVAVGADYIIGVDISDKTQTYYELNNVGDIFSQIMNILVKTNRQNIPKLDVYVRPDMSGYSSLSFNPQAIDTIQARGNSATKLKYDELQALKSRMQEAEPQLRAAPAVDINGRKVAIGEVQFKGLGGEDEKVLEHLAGIPEFSEVDAADIQAASSRLLGSGVFETINYSLCGKEAPYTLLFNAKRAPAHQVGVGVRFDTEEWGEVLLGLGLNARKLRGMMFDFEAKVGMNQRLGARLSYSAIGTPAVNLEVNFSNNNYKVCTLNRMSERGKYDTGHIFSEVKLYLSNLQLIHANVQGGLYFRHLGETHTPISYNECYFGAFANALWDSFDDWYFPTRGLKAKLGVECDYASVSKSTRENYKPITNVNFDIKGAIPCCEQLTILPDFHLRHIFGRTEEMLYTLLHRNTIGGDIGGRYFSNQVPFAAISDVYAYESGEVYMDHLAVLNVELRYNPLKNLFLSVFGGCFNQGRNYADLFKSVREGHYGAGVQAAYRTVAGPVKFNVHYSSLSGWGAYLSLGMDF